ncbi:hypothetical protein ACFT1B_27585 [Streptomyces griseoincarnatus]|uniref:Secreted protein n=3 Tax=Streptomyces TaxID=1883 RepID=A0ABN3WN76_9ACTN|nr:MULTISPECIES: hypothetical protein [Streptomyces]MDH3032786.1 hypothetical protein [Streptomyces sp. TRM75561]MQL65866.1 hypothetical protein [Streptomyces vinaceus]GGP50911.1 hypothetical protein GCM10010265_31180 [Streptomyces griseoincarnatus]GGT64519.1 hypothetical protein GCM10010287_43850 [Streptomyces variabilis]
MATAAYVFPPVLSKPVAEPSASEAEHSACDPHDCFLSAEGTGAEAPLTSEPPLRDAEPLTSEPPLADTTPLTSESDTFSDPSDFAGLDSFPAQYHPEP